VLNSIWASSESLLFEVIDSAIKESNNLTNRRRVILTIHSRNYEAARVATERWIRRSAVTSLQIVKIPSADTGRPTKIISTIERAMSNWINARHGRSISDRLTFSIDEDLSQRIFFVKDLQREQNILILDAEHQLGRISREEQHSVAVRTNGYRQYALPMVFIWIGSECISNPNAVVPRQSTVNEPFDFVCDIQVPKFMSECVSLFKLPIVWKRDKIDIDIEVQKLNESEPSTSDNISLFIDASNALSKQKRKMQFSDDFWSILESLNSMASEALSGNRYDVLLVSLYAEQLRRVVSDESHAIRASFEPLVKLVLHRASLLTSNSRSEEFKKWVGHLEYFKGISGLSSEQLGILDAVYSNRDNSLFSELAKREIESSITIANNSELDPLLRIGVAHRIMHALHDLVSSPPKEVVGTADWASFCEAIKNAGEIFGQGAPT
jgi:hypothetical protein